ncbi:MAG: DUF4270 family protein [Bacteroidales bacterium]
MDKNLGQDYIPSEQELQVFSVDASRFLKFNTVLMDSNNTAAFSTAILGRMNHPEFGKTSVGFATEFFAGQYAYTFEEGVQGLDSAFLLLGFSSTYGDSKTPMEIEVYELSKKINGDSSIYSASERIKNMIYPQRVDAGESPHMITADSSAISIRLSAALLPKLFQVQDEETFLENFKGLYVRVKDDVAEGCIKYVDLVNTSSAYASSALIAYYHYYDEGAEKDSVRSYTYHVSNGTAGTNTPRFNVVEHENKAATLSSEALYTQGFGGVAIQLAILQDSLKAWTNGRTYAVNRAELLLPVHNNTEPDKLDLYAQRMSALQLNSGDRTYSKYSTPRDVYTNTFDGNINRSQMKYSLNITHFFNDALLKGDEKLLYLVPYTYLSAYNGVSIRNTGQNRPQLKITYGEIK